MTSEDYPRLQVALTNGLKALAHGALDPSCKEGRGI